MKAVLALLGWSTAFGCGGDAADRVDAAMIDAAIVDAAMIDAPMVDAAMIDAAIVDAAIVDAAMIDAAIVDAAIADAAPAIDGPPPIDAAPPIDGPSVAITTVPCAGADIAVTVLTQKSDYSPEQMTIAIGQIVRFAPLPPHDVVAGTVAAPQSWFQIDGNTIGCVRFDQAGTFPFFCTAHPFSMNGRVIVAPATVWPWSPGNASSPPVPRWSPSRSPRARSAPTR